MSTWRSSEEHERFHIDSGPRVNALQVVSEALDIPQQQQDEEDSCHASSSPTDDSSYNNHHGNHATKTIVASDSDVSNGFVKSGRNLPYVFEASESGVRKRSSKILPVCAVCGKRFVCVTTMKRHLVTHTGEKPFSCKVCGKQYTQKGNLRVHERTHRNDRPFECNICHQKFYRKEPMQKHQWRQHGIVHFKSRPSNEQAPTQAETAPTAPTPTPTPAPTPLTIEPPKPLIPLRPAKPTSYTALVDSLRASSRENSPYRSDPPPFAPPAAHQTLIDVPKFTPAALLQDQNEFKHAKSTPMPLPSSTVTSSTASSSASTSPGLVPSTSSAQQAEQQPQQQQSSSSSSSSFSYSSILNETPNTHLLIVPSTTTNNTPISSSESSSDHIPLKLKMKKAFASATVSQDHLAQPSQQQPVSQQQQPNEVHNLDHDLNDMKIGPNEMVECQCKTCGNTFSVVDPYNFRCNNCNVKYTSLPTHLIADPLQCIGCCAVFPHKPALKAHQTVSDKERPFRCCKCGYGFRQKAHLQKHQWRIHRRKLEPDQNMKEAEAFFEVIRTSQPQPQVIQHQNAAGNTITMQDIINKSVENSIGEGPRNLMKTSSKYYSEVLGLEYEPKSCSSEDDDSNSNDQPLDLSPAKKLDHPITVNQPSLPPATTLDYPAWKKQKTTNDSTHTSLPPITGLQKPMSLVTVKNYKHSSWISAEINNPTTADRQSVEQQLPSQHPQPQNGKNNNTFVRSQLELLKSSNARTV